MKPRQPTSEEIRLWRASNRFTQRKKENEEPAETSFSEEIVDAPSAKAPGGNASIPSKKTPPNAKLHPLPVREARRRLKSHPEIEAVLDLHGLTKLAAYEEVARFLRVQHQKGRRHVLIITGKGRQGEGVLRSALPHWLNESALRPTISAFAAPRPEKGGEGVMHILLKARQS
jgi:DNA-nicking Smr family endonuclease